MESQRLEHYECDDCGELLEKDDIRRVNGSIYCQNCFDNEYFTCDCCGKIRPNNEIKMHNDDLICQDCFDELFFFCDDCGNSYPNDEALSYVGNYICRQCYENCYFTCDCCGEVTHLDDSDGDCHCTSCSKSVVIKQARYVPTEFHYKGDGPLYLGIELEVESPEENPDNVADGINRDNLIYCKHDGSLRQGFEIVSHPWSIDEHVTFDWQNILNILRKHHCKSHDTKTCGLHVHVSKILDGRQIIKLVTIVNLNHDTFTKLARRDSSYATYKQVKNISLKDLPHSHNRYEAVNLTNCNTIEFRIFRGTLNYLTFIGSIILCHYLIKFVKETDISVSRYYHKPNEVFSEFITWTKSQKHNELFTEYYNKMQERG